MTKKIRVGVVDEYPLFRDGVIHTLEAQPDIEVIGQGTSARDVLRIACECEPDVIVLDLSITGGLHAITEMALKHPASKILMLAGGVDNEQVCAALKQGARGCLTRGTTSRELAQTVRIVAQGEHYVSPSLAAALLMRTGSAQNSTNNLSGRFSDLTRREDQILSILVEGRSNKEIGNKLDLSEKTIKHHVTNILQKLQVRNRVEAALLASERVPQHLTISG